jgi:hypothetical protein
VCFLIRKLLRYFIKLPVLLLLFMHIASSCKLSQGVYTLKDGFAFSFLSSGQVWPRFRSLGLISPLIRRINKALGRVALLILL